MSKQGIRAAVMLLGVTVVGCLRAQETKQQPALRARVDAVIQQYLNTRLQADSTALGELFTEDADQLVSSGEWRRGREALVRGTLASSKAEGGRRSVTLESVRRVAPGVAVADGRYELTGIAGGATRRMWSTFVLVEQNGAWKIAAIRNMLPAKPAAALPH